ncbi:MAG: hypothetical protein H6860_02305 [Rhodospirillales bacterium]|nr:hypothetical protein [Alphaproteobacteria bacterium]MCB9981213.1 hypothetical protein [Rhodospirillales bacterium]
MSNASAPDSESDPENQLTSERFDELKEALEVLYVIANISGRIQFAQKWEAPAAYVLGAELIRYDQDGTDDREHRAELEREAEERRLSLLEFMDAIEERSVEKGALQIDFVREKVEKMGRDLALCVYGRQIVDKFIAPPPEPLQIETEDEAVKDSEGSQEAEVVLESSEMASDLVSEPFDVKPIDMSLPDERVRPIEISPPAGVQISAPASARVQETSLAGQPALSQGGESEQKAVLMKFVSSKDQKEEDDSSGSAPPSDQAS